jgi:hypothetical protein
MPKDKEGVLNFELDWNSLLKNGVVEKVCRPWIAKKIKEYMGVEEPTMINLTLKLLN